MKMQNNSPSLRLTVLIILFFSALLFSCKNFPFTGKGEGGQNKFKKDFVITDLDKLPANRGLTMNHYPASNERRIDLFEPYVKNLGGGYIGVGTDQNFTFIAWARSRYAWLIDFDPVVVAINKIHFLFIKKSATFNDYENLWARKNKKKSFTLIKEQFYGARDYKLIKRAWKVATRGHRFSDVPYRFGELKLMVRKFKLKTFVNVVEDYNYIRSMVLGGRIQAIPGDLTGKKTLRAIAESAKKMDLTIRMLYTSNAEEYFRFPEAYRQNIIRLPTDNRSLLIRTVSVGVNRIFTAPVGERYPEKYPFHYNVQSFNNMKKWMQYKTKLSIIKMLRDHKPIKKGLSIMSKGPPEKQL